MASGQTLYSLARRYGTSVSEIKAKNAELVNELKVGQTINIPYGKPMGQPEVPTKSVPQTVNKTNLSHTVASGETLFSISQMYNVEVEALKKLNSLSSNALAVGQTLKISAANPVQAQESANAAVTTNPNVNQASNQVETTISTVPKILSTEKKIVVTESNNNYNGTPFEEIVEEGQAELIVEGESSTKFLALHKTAKVGTVIKVRNRMNDLTVYVRVVGEIPNTTDNENIIIKLNKRAYDQLKALDNRFLVELSYFQ